MRIILTVQSGPLAGRNLILQPGQSGLVGRASWADLSIQDAEMSGRHFSLECEADGCRIRDFGSKNGTLVNGVKVTDVKLLQHGNQILSGQTTFLVQIEQTLDESPEVDEEPMSDELRTTRVTKGPAARVPVTPPSPPTAPVPPRGSETERLAFAILEIREGPNAGKKLVLKPGETGMVGRASWADMPVHDIEMSGRHFEVVCEHRRCVIRDLGSKNGTILNGTKITESTLHEGDQILIGQTVVSVRIETESMAAMTTMTGMRQVIQEVQQSIQAAAAAPEPPSAEPEEPEERRSSVLKALFPGGKPPEEPRTSEPATILSSPRPTAAPAGAEEPQFVEAPERKLVLFLRAHKEPLFALLDCGHDPRVLQIIKEEEAESHSLYEGPAGDLLAQWAPVLVPLRADSSLLDALVHEGWGKNWGIYFTSPRPVEELRDFFRLLLRASSARDQVFFRLHDPRVLRVYFPTCTPEQTALFFGETVTSYLLETKVSNTVLKFTPSGMGVRKEVMALWLKQ